MKNASVLLISLLVLAIIPHVTSAQSNDTISSPHEQFVSHISLDNIKCKNGLQVIAKKENNSPACVISGTFSKLISRGWGYDPFHEWTVEKLNNTYKVGQQINFLIKFKGWSAPCFDGPFVEIKDQQGKKVWIYVDTPLCPVQSFYDQIYLEKQWNINTPAITNGYNLGIPGINHVGVYYISIMQDSYVIISQKNITIAP